MRWVRAKSGLPFGKRVLAGFLLAQYAFLNFWLGLLKAIFFSKRNTNAPRRILLLKQGGFGDTISVLPAFFALRKAYPDAVIDLLSHPPLLETVTVAEIVPDDMFQHVYMYEKFIERDLKRMLKANAYDLYIELPSYMASFSFELRSLFLAKSLRIPGGFGWQVSSNTFLRKKQEQVLSFDNDRQRMLAILIQNGVIDEQDVPGAVDQTKTYLETSVKGAYPILNRKSIALVIGAGTERKQWPYFQSVVKYYSDKGYDIFLVGGKQDKIPGDQLAASAPNVKNLCGQLSWVETGSVLQQCELVISNDTGPLHLAYSLDKPVIGIYAAHNYTNQWYPPATEKTAVLRNNEVPCIICYKKACRNNICMQGIEDKKVIAEADRLLRANSIA